MKITIYLKRSDSEWGAFVAVPAGPDGPMSNCVAWDNDKDAAAQCCKRFVRDVLGEEPEWVVEDMTEEKQ